MENDGADLHPLGRKIDELPPMSRTSMINTSIGSIGSLDRVKTAVVPPAALAEHHSPKGLPHHGLYGQASGWTMANSTSELPVYTRVPAWMHRRRP